MLTSTRRVRVLTLEEPRRLSAAPFPALLLTSLSTPCAHALCLDFTDRIYDSDDGSGDWDTEPPQELTMCRTGCKHST